MVNIAVYGTLRRGGSANQYMKGALFVSHDKIKGKLYSLGSFPSVKLSDDTVQEVVVDVYEVPISLLPLLDRYEGYIPGSPEQSLFVRKVTKTISGKEVQVYEFNGGIDESRRVLSGDWFDECERAVLSA